MRSLFSLVVTLRSLRDTVVAGVDGVAVAAAAVGVAVGAGGCFPLDRVLSLPPGTVRGTTEPNARVDLVGSSVTRRADGDGVFVVSGLGAGTVRFRITKDDDGDGAAERGAVHDVFMGDDDGAPLGVDLGAIALQATGSIRGVVVDEGGAPAGGARVVVARGGRAAGDVLSAAEQETGAGSDGAFRLRGVVSGDVVVVAARAGAVSEGSDVAVAPGAETVIADVALVAADEFDVAVVVDGPAGLAATLNGAPVALDAGLRATAGVGYVLDVRDSAHFGTLFSQIVPNGPLPSVSWGTLVVSDVDPCPPEGDRDCDGDGQQGLPALSGEDDDDLATWRACDAACGAFGDVGESCAVDGVTFDCDDDNDGQPDVTEPFACVGPGKGTDLDGDLLCSTVDPFPECAANDAAACAPIEDDDVFVPPPPLVDNFVAPVDVPCGDGDLDDGEACDDGNTVDGDGCEGDCSLVCGADSGASAAAVGLDGRCLLRFETALTWTAADADCRGRGGNLATDDDGQLAVLGDELWIGLTDRRREGAFRWQSNAPFDAVDDDRFGVPPDDAGVGQDCVVREGDVWFDDACDGVTHAAYACELGAPPRHGDGIVDADEDCDDGNDDNGDGCEADGSLACGIAGLSGARATLTRDGRCWLDLGVALTHADATARCAAGGAALPTLNSVEDLARFGALTAGADAWTGLVQSGDALGFVDGNEQLALAAPFEDGSLPDQQGADVWFVRPFGHGFVTGDDVGLHRTFCQARGVAPDAVCGDGIRVDGEGCDDGNTVDGDGCDADCVPGCGDGGSGVLDDAGVCVSLVFDGACDARWQPASLAELKRLADRFPPLTRVDGEETKVDDDFGVAFALFAAGEPDGRDNGRDDAHCLALVDGRMVDQSCALPAPQACVPPPALCGDGVVGGDEDCDDANLVNGDGCDACRFPCAAGPGAVRAIAVDGACFWARETFDDVAGAQSACAAVAGGKLAEPRTREEIRATARLDVALRKKNGDQGGVLLGMNDSANEGEFVFASDDTPISEDAFVDGEGVNDTEDCLMMKSGWRDIACDAFLNSVCQSPSVTPAFCGDGVVGAGEDCDDGNASDGDGCETSCTLTCGPAGVARLGLPLSDGSCAWLADDAAARGVWSSKALSYCNGGGAPNTTPLVIDAEIDSRRLFHPSLADVYDELGVVYIGITEDPAFGFPGGVTFGSPGHFLGRQPVNFNGLQSPTQDPADNGSCFGFVTDGMIDLSCFGSARAPIWCTAN